MNLFQCHKPKTVKQLLEEIIMNQADATSALNAAASKLDVVKAAIAVLQAQVSAGNVTPELETAVSVVAGKADALVNQLTPVTPTP